jgi:hypothetical protein
VNLREFNDDKNVAEADSGRVYAMVRVGMVLVLILAVHMISGYRD